MQGEDDGPPPAFQYEGPTLEGTIKPYPKFDDNHTEQMVKDFQRAFRGIGTDENRIIRILTEHDSAQRLSIKAMYKAATGKDLIEDLKDELSGNFEDLCVALLVEREAYLVWCLKEALRNFGTNEGWLIEILVARTVDEMSSIKKAYEEKYESSLEDDLSEDTSGTFKRVLVSVIQGGREQKEAHEVDQDQVMKDAEDLYNAGEGKFGTDEDTFNRVFALRSWAHLRAVCQQYKLKAGRELEETLDREFCFSEKKAFVTIVKYAKDPCMYFAERFHEALVDDADETLTRLMVEHCETDLAMVKQRFREKYGETLEEMIRNECHGDYRKLLLRLCDPTKSFT